MPPGPAYGVIWVPTGECVQDAPGIYFERTGSERVQHDVTFYDDGTGCRPTSQSDSGYAAVRVDPSVFVGSKLAYEPLGDDVGRLVAVHDDGSLEVVGAASDGVPCEPYGPGGACVPTTRARAVNGFADESCSSEPAPVAVPFCGATVALTQTEGCFDAEVFTLGDTANGVGFVDVDAYGSLACTAVQPGAVVATRRTLDDFPALSTTLVTGSSPGLAARHDAVGDVPTSLRARLETADGVPCEPWSDTSIANACVPAPLAHFVGNYFADDRCFEPLVEIEPYLCRGVPRSTLAFTAMGEYEIRSVEQTPFTGTVYAYGETCGPVEGDLPQLYAMGPAYDLASLPRLEVVRP
jgi:hypothetical protein